MWAPQPGPQADAISATWCPEIFFGGAAGGGKSDFLLGDYLQDVPTYGSAWRGIIFRRTYPELEELLARAHEIFPPSGGKWREQKRTWIWPNGATLKFRYCERDKDARRYQGHQYTWIGWDELTQWASLFAYRFLRSRLRSAQPVPTKRIRGAGNPGGPGHLEVKSYFIDPAPMGFEPIFDEVTGTERMFVPSKLSDNAILVANDAGYEGRLRGLGGLLAEAMLAGNWDIIEGAYFDCWDPGRHIVRPFPIPETWMRFRAGDWGSAKPFSIGWWAVVGDDTPVIDEHRQTRVVLPRGALVRYREWYGCKDGQPNTGLKLTAEQVAAGIAQREKGEKIALGVLDPAAFAEDGGPSIAERMATSHKVYWNRADNARVPHGGAMGGWDAMRSRFIGEDPDRPMIACFSTCKDSIRTIPVLQHDATNAEDLDTEGEDHAADEWRYACMSRPWVRAPDPTRPKGDRYARNRNRRSAGSAWAA